jgi:hypothetical protein
LGVEFQASRPSQASEGDPAHRPVTEAGHRVVHFDPSINLSGFACGDAAYDTWLSQDAAASVSAGVCAAYLLLQ